MSLSTLAEWSRTVSTEEVVWLSVGFAAQALFAMRFLVQWVVTERAKRSVMPIAFWYFSLGGGVMLLVYALYRMDPVFILGQSLGLVVYSRNLYFIHRVEHDEAVPGADGGFSPVERAVAAPQNKGPAGRRARDARQSS